MQFSELVKRVRRLIGSSKFFYGLIGLVVISCLLFIVSITYKIPPDEYYHFRFIEFYANQPIANGPFIADQGTDFFDLRDITRTPNYLYHYLMSFGLRGTRWLTGSLFAQVVALRLVTLALGITSLFVVRRVLRQVGASRFVQNSVLALLGLTGMLLWIFSSVNYDVPSLLLYLLCVSVCLSLINSPGLSLRRLAWLALLCMLCVLTKVTFAPFLVLLGLATLVIKRKDLRLKNDLKLKTWRHGLLVLAVVVAGWLFVERIGGNLIKYQQIDVSCDRIHAYEQCMEDDVFSRNENQLRAYEQQKARGDGVTYQPYQFTQMWSAFMYERSHFYYGHEQMRANDGAKIFAVMTAAAFTILAIFWRKRIVETPGERLLFWITLTYAAVMYIFNAQTWLKFGQPYAFQGRYLFPVIPFLYYFCIKLLVLTYRASRGNWRGLFVGAVAVLIILSAYLHLPLLVFYRGTEAKWYSNPTRGFNLGVQDILGKINIKTLL